MSLRGPRGPSSPLKPPSPNPSGAARSRAKTKKSGGPAALKTPAPTDATDRLEPSRGTTRGAAPAHIATRSAMAAPQKKTRLQRLTGALRRGGSQLGSKTVEKTAEGATRAATLGAKAGTKAAGHALEKAAASLRESSSPMPAAAAAAVAKSTTTLLTPRAKIHEDLSRASPAQLRSMVGTRQVGAQLSKGELGADNGLMQKILPQGEKLAADAPERALFADRTMNYLVMRGVVNSDFCIAGDLIGPDGQIDMGKLKERLVPAGAKLGKGAQAAVLDHLDVPGTKVPLREVANAVSKSQTKFCESDPKTSIQPRLEQDNRRLAALSSALQACNLVGEEGVIEGTPTHELQATWDHFVAQTTFDCMAQLMPTETADNLVAGLGKTDAGRAVFHALSAQVQGRVLGGVTDALENLDSIGGTGLDAMSVAGSVAGMGGKAIGSAAAAKARQAMGLELAPAGQREAALGDLSPHVALAAAFERSANGDRSAGVSAAVVDSLGGPEKAQEMLNGPLMLDPAFKDVEIKLEKRDDGSFGIKVEEPPVGWLQWGASMVGASSGKEDFKPLVSQGVMDAAPDAIRELAGQPVFEEVKQALSAQPNAPRYAFDTSDLTPAAQITLDTFFQSQGFTVSDTTSPRTYEHTASRIGAELGAAARRGVTTGFQDSAPEGWVARAGHQALQAGAGFATEQVVAKGYTALHEGIRDAIQSESNLNIADVLDAVGKGMGTASGGLKAAAAAPGAIAKNAPSMGDIQSVSHQIDARTEGLPAGVREPLRNMAKGALENATDAQSQLAVLQLLVNMVDAKKAADAQ